MLPRTVFEDWNKEIINFHSHFLLVFFHYVMLKVVLFSYFNDPRWCCVPDAFVPGTALAVLWQSEGLCSESPSC